MAVALQALVAAAVLKKVRELVAVLVTVMAGVMMEVVIMDNNSRGGNVSDNKGGDTKDSDREVVMEIAMTIVKGTVRELMPLVVAMVAAVSEGDGGGGHHCLIKGKVREVMMVTIAAMVMTAYDVVMVTP